MTSDASFIPDGQPSVLKPFRILISLLDKPEIGPVVIESVLLSVFRRLKNESELDSNVEMGQNSGQYNKLPVETLKTANLLFGSFEPYFIWDFLARIFTSACEQRSAEKEKASEVGGEPVSIMELCDLIGFLLEVIALVSDFVNVYDSRAATLQQIHGNSADFTF